MPMRELDCPNCGANFKNYTPGAQINCGYCGTTFLAPSADAPPPQQPFSGAGPRIDLGQIQAAPANAGRAGMLIAAAFGSVSVVVAAAVFLVAGGAVDIVPRASARHVPYQVGAQRSGWDDVGGSPMPTSVGGKPAVVGRTRDYGEA